MKPITQAPLPPHEQAARRARATILHTPRPAPPTPLPYEPQFTSREREIVPPFRPGTKGWDIQHGIPRT